MNDLPNRREELEAKLTALLLGELPADEAFALGRAIEQDAELAMLYARLKETVGLVREATVADAGLSAPAPDLKLSAQRREKLLAQFKTVEPQELSQSTRQEVSWLIPVGIAAAFTALLGGMLLPALSKAKTKSMASRQNSLSMFQESLSPQKFSKSTESLTSPGQEN